ncbi:MAG: phosphoribosylaminoimidazolesuccinocarboxamide synthase [Spirochaetes bacterium RBG_16_49_21]|nr:MAG: phosphoribosylaminoimidazolesuccinocarboxamide synthase [Spirochaetes bacterium RBG_16_49_21]
MGSVKDLKIIQEPTGINSGVGFFSFSDRYSVFDWGEMPDHIAGKGKALCIIGAYFFEKLLEAGIDSHYRGLVGNDGVIRQIKDMKEAPDIMAVSLYRVIRPIEKNGSYDYSEYRGTSVNFLIPLEVIYRNRLPEGSSVLKRLAEGSVSLADLGLTNMPGPGDVLEWPILDVSTKLEATDRYLPWSEAKAISGLADTNFNNMEKLTERINTIITSEVERIGLVNEDGKMEFAIDNSGNVVVVDVLGTPDECRFTYNGIHVSKELARVFYRETDWYRDLESAKKKNRLAWKSLVASNPPHLPDQLSGLISSIYQAVANELTGMHWFRVRPLSEIMKDIQYELAKSKQG